MDSIRRGMRLWWVIAAVAYVMGVLLAHHLARGLTSTVVHSLAQVVGQVVLKLAWLGLAVGHPSALLLLSVPGRRRGDVPSEPASAPDHLASLPRVESGGSPTSTIRPFDALRQRQVIRVREAMEKERMYRRSRLTVAELARDLGITEARLRLLIQEHFGFGHFSAFLNHFRLMEVARRLRDPNESHLPVLTLALEAGFGSIGPFNRAFRHAFGVTPTAFRRGEGPTSGAGQVESFRPLGES